MLRSPLLVCALFVACGDEADVLGQSGEEPAVPEPTASEDAVKGASGDGAVTFKCEQSAAPAVVEDEAWYGRALDLTGPLRVGFDASVPEAGRVPLREAVAWFESVSDGFEFVWVADDEARDIGFAADGTGDGGYCTGCCNGAARTASIELGPDTLDNAEDAWVTGIHEIGHALGLAHILPRTWRSVMNRFGPFDPTSPYADGQLDTQLVCALHNGTLGCFVGDDAASEAHIRLGFQNADGIPCPEWVPPAPLTE